jgi:hypothetical protein
MFIYSILIKEIFLLAYFSELYYHIKLRTYYCCHPATSHDGHAETVKTRQK